MPVLSVYFGSSEVNFLLLNDDKDYRTYRYPYSNAFDPDFFSDLLKLAAKEMKTSFSDVDIVTTGFPFVPNHVIEPKLSLTLDQVSAQITGYSAIMVNTYNVIGPNDFFSSQMRRDLDNGSDNYLANLSIYPQITSLDLLDNYAIDNFVRFFHPDLEPKIPVLFSGERFASSRQDAAISYLLMFDLIKSPGVYDIKVDKENIFPNLAMQVLYNPKVSQILTEYEFTNVGTVINSKGPVECLVESDLGSSQFLEVKDDELFALPVLDASNTRLSIKSSSLGHMEYFVSGGELGLIIDTRPKDIPEVFNENYAERSLKSHINPIKESINKL